MPVTIIAEAGVNHNGDLETAKRMAYVAKECGADIVKYQTAVPELVGSRFAEKVNYLATISAIEMNVAINISIITYAMFIDCDHLSRIVLTQHSECVVNGCLAQCWDTLG